MNGMDLEDCLEQLSKTGENCFRVYAKPKMVTEIVDESREITEYTIYTDRLNLLGTYRCTRVYDQHKRLVCKFGEFSKQKILA